MIKKCLICNKEFKTKLSRIKKGYGKYCSQQCYSIGSRGKRNIKKGYYIECLICKKEFYIEPSQLKSKKFCSRKCFAQSKRNKPLTEGHKNNIKKSLKRGETHPFYGKHHNQKMRDKIKKTLLGRFRGSESPNWKGGRPKCIDCGKQLFDYKAKYCINCRQKGIRHYNWKGGISPLENIIRDLVENKNWQKQIFLRDNYICKECGKYGGKLTAHHIKSFSQIFKEFLQQYSQFSPIEDKETLIRLAITYEPFWDVSNGKTLCKECHQKTDTYAGKNLIKAGQSCQNT